MNRVVFVDTRFYNDLGFLDRINLKEGDYAFIPALNKRHINMFIGMNRSYEVAVCCREELRDVDSFVCDAAYNVIETFADKGCSIEIVTQDKVLCNTLLDMNRRLSSSSSLSWVNRATDKKTVFSKEREDGTQRRKVTLDKSGVTFNAVNIFNYNLTKLKSHYGKVTKLDFEKYVYCFARNFIKHKNLKDFYDSIGLVSNGVVSVELLEDFLKTIYDCHGVVLFNLIKEDYARLVKVAN
mgnify:CR=1 FL=1